jgi:hypothetical protein
MKYPVLNDFIEKFHKNMLYKKGETYPKEGFEADPERVKYLQSEKNKYKIPFLGPEIKEEVASFDEHVEESSDETKTAKKGSKNNKREKTPAEK